jgi:hypothetical protein
MCGSLHSLSGSECCLLPVAAAGAVTEVVTLEVEWDWYSGSSVI